MQVMVYGLGIMGLQGVERARARGLRGGGGGGGAQHCERRRFQRFLLATRLRDRDQFIVLNCLVL